MALFPICKATPITADKGGQTDGIEKTEQIRDQSIIPKPLNKYVLGIGVIIWAAQTGSICDVEYKLKSHLKQALQQNTWTTSGLLLVVIILNMLSVQFGHFPWTDISFA